MKKWEYESHLSKQLSILTPDVIDKQFLARFLNFNSEARIAAKTALEHPSISIQFDLKDLHLNPF